MGRILLFLWGLIAVLYAIVTLASKGPLGSIEAGIAFLIATVAIGSAFILEAIQRIGVDALYELRARHS